ncbi:Uncharacterized protein TCAP_00475 [Tolypocladium capitatum]|uniref:Aminoglycoside phosphotransferase domain-containing protein n=1 Tax=Tolypocladium capitatum TaxID=45235 RepID=A0A2K3QQ17_9HYPO|nr:Uncharacterized protein TCAP_00475 [Tolypocladium capitatum]
MQLSDLHASNILVDSCWNVTAVIDLEWVCARPAEMIDVPYWITGLGIVGFCQRHVYPLSSASSAKIYLVSPNGKHGDPVVEVLAREG